MPTEEYDGYQEKPDRNTFDFKPFQLEFSSLNEEVEEDFIRQNVEKMISELNAISLIPLDIKDSLVDYISKGNLGKGTNKELENIVSQILFGKNYDLSGNLFQKLVYQPIVYDFRAWKLKYILDNKNRPLFNVISEIQQREILEAKKENNSTTQNPSQRQTNVEQKNSTGSAWETFQYWMGKGKEFLKDQWDNFVGYLDSVTTPVKDWFMKKFFTDENKENTNEILKLYELLKGKDKPDFMPFFLGYQSYLNLKNENAIKNDTYLTICDFSKSNRVNRFFVINMKTLEVEHATQVAHGKNSGREFARNFSNRPGSNQSCLGCFITPNFKTPNRKRTWSGLRLMGKDKIGNDKVETDKYSNTNASERGIYIHAVGEVQYSNGTSTSEGCFAIPSRYNPDLIMGKVKGGSLLFAYYPDLKYISQSKYTQPGKKIAA